MTFKDVYCDMTWFALVVDVIHHQCKSIKSSMWHSQIKCGFQYNSFNKLSMKNMTFHGLIDHVKDYFIHEWYLENNSATLAKD
jgi:hypothetical protein